MAISDQHPSAGIIASIVTVAVVAMVVASAVVIHGGDNVVQNVGAVFTFATPTIAGLFAWNKAVKNESVIKEQADSVKDVVGERTQVVAETVATHVDTVSDKLDDKTVFTTGDLPPFLSDEKDGGKS